MIGEKGKRTERWKEPRGDASCRNKGPAQHREVWELTQGEVEIRLPHQVSPARLEHLPISKPGQLVPTPGLLVPKRHERAFDTILWLGDVELVDVGRGPC